MDDPMTDVASKTPVGVLIVDDRRENRIALQAILSSPDYRLVEASSGSEALRRLLDDEFAVLLLDVVMPEMNGFELARVIRARDKTASTPIIFLTAQATDWDLVYKGYLIGAVDYLVKPLVPEMVRAKVAVFAELYRQAKRIEHQSALLLEVERREGERRVTKLRRAAERRERQFLAELKGTLDAVLDAVLIFDPNTLSFFYFNHGAQELWGYTQDELMGMSPFELIVDYDEAKFRQLLAPLYAGKQTSIIVEARCRKKDGTELPAEFSFQRVPSQKNQIVSIGRDITERKVAERERERLYKEALDAVRARDEFMSIASHELKTPLQSLKLQLELLLLPPERGPSLTAGELSAKLRKAMRLVDRIAALISDLMDASRISAGKLGLEFEQFDLSELCREVLDRFEDVAVKANCTVTFDGSRKIVGRWDRFRIDQVLTNLMSNAVKFGAGKPIEVTVAVEDSRARLVVRDHGIGFSPEHAERIFRRFERAPTKQRYGGMGLGLYIVRQIIDAHGGTIHATAEPGAGTCFTVELPLESGESASASVT